MGNKHSNDNGSSPGMSPGMSPGQFHANRGFGGSGSTTTPSVSGSPSTQQQPISAQDLYGTKKTVPKFYGFGPEGSAGGSHHRIIPDDVAAAVHAAFPDLHAATSGSTAGTGYAPACLQRGPANDPDEEPALPEELNSWYLLFNSNLHGRSFNRMLQLVCERGPTVIVIKEQNTQGRVFGGFNVSSWQNVAAREKSARSQSAARSRASRHGHGDEAFTRPENQGPQFFGDEKCFLFTDTDPVAGVKLTESSGGVDAANIHRGKTSINSNFMYLYDTHPDDDKIGMGMGGQPMRHGWFIDRWLENGHCRGTKCTTFGNPALSQLENFTIDAVEVYAVDPKVVKAMIDQFGNDGASPVFGTSTHAAKQAKKKGPGCGVLGRGSETNCDKMLLQLHTNHNFYSDQIMDPSQIEDGASDDGDEAPPPSGGDGTVYKGDGRGGCDGSMY